MLLHFRAPRVLATALLLLLVLLGVRSLPLSVAGAQDKIKVDAPKDVQLQLEQAHKQIQVMNEELQRMRAEMQKQAQDLKKAMQRLDALEPKMKIQLKSNIPPPVQPPPVPPPLRVQMSPGALLPQHGNEARLQEINRKLDLILQELAKIRNEGVPKEKPARKPVPAP